MKIVKISGKTWRDSKDFVTLYHVSPNKLSSLQPLSKFERYTGLFMSDSYKSIIRDWAGYVQNKKHKNSEEYQEAGYKTLYIHKIECPKEVYEQATALFNFVYESGYRKDSFGFWGWGSQIFIPKNLLPSLKIINIEKIDEAQLIKKEKGFSMDSYRAQKPSFKMTPEQKEEFDQKEKELREVKNNMAMNKNWYKKAKLEDVPETMQKMFGLGKYQPETKYRKCPKCGEEKAYAKEMHPDTDMNEMVLWCKNCGEVGEL